MKDRLKKIRKELNLTQHEIANKLGISRNNIATYETGKSEPGDAVVSLICREFNVNETWLRTGEGEMFDRSETFSLDAYAKERDMSNLDLLLIKCYLEMPKEMRTAFIHHLKEALVATDELVSTEKIISQNQKSGIKQTIPDSGLDTEKAFLEAVRQEYRKEKIMELSVSQNIDLKEGADKKN